MKMIKFLLILLLSLPVQIYAQHQKLIAVHKKKTFRISKGDTIRFELKLEPEKNYKIIVEQKGIDVGIRLKDKDDQELAYQDSPNGKFGPELIYLTTTDHHQFYLYIEPLNEESNTRNGIFSIQVEETDDHKIISRILQPKEMKKDLQIFRNIREKVNSGFYRYRTQQQVDSIYQWAFHSIKQPLPITEFYKILLILTDFEGSNHNSTSLPVSPVKFIRTDKGFFPFFLKHIEGNKAVINNDNDQIPLGSEIISINGMPVPHIQQRFYKYFPTDGYNITAKHKASIENSFGWLFPFEFGTSDSFVIEYKAPNTGKVEKIKLQSVDIEGNRKLYFQRHSAKTDSIIDFTIQEKYSFELLNGSTALLNFRIFDMADHKEDPRFEVFSDYLDSVFRKINKEGYEHLIIDIRNNPGGNDPTYEKVFTYLTDHPFKENTSAYIIFDQLPYPKYFRWHSSDKSNQKREQKELNAYLQSVFSVKEGDKFFQHQKHNPIYKPDPNRYRGKVYLLIDENVGSAASHFASLVRAYADAVIIGVETTGGYYGHNGHFPVEYQLPYSKISSRFSIVHVEQDAPEKSTQPAGRGIIPDYTILTTSEDFLEQKDTQLNFVLELIRQNK